MAWAALIPIAAQVIGAMGKKDQPQQPQGQLPAPPSMGELMAAHQKAWDQPDQTQAPQFNAFQQAPIGGGSRGQNG